MFTPFYLKFIHKGISDVVVVALDLQGPLCQKPGVVVQRSEPSQLERHQVTAFHTRLLKRENTEYFLEAQRGIAEGWESKQQWCQAVALARETLWRVTPLRAQRDKSPKSSSHGSPLHLSDRVTCSRRW